MVGPAKEQVTVAEHRTSTLASQSGSCQPLPLPRSPTSSVSTSTSYFSLFHLTLTVCRAQSRVEEGGGISRVGVMRGWKLLRWPWPASRRCLGEGRQPISLPDVPAIPHYPRHTLVLRHGDSQQEAQARHTPRVGSVEKNGNFERCFDASTHPIAACGIACGGGAACHARQQQHTPLVPIGTAPAHSRSAT